MRVLGIALGMLLLGPMASHAQTAVISGQTIDTNGIPLPFAQVRVCSVTSTGDPCTPTASVYLDYNLTVPAANPYTSDAFGNYLLYGGALSFPNLYMVQLSPTSGVTWTYVVNGPYCSISGCTFTGPVTATIFNATQSPYYEINGTQISSAALSDAANLAKLNAANVFTASPQTAPIFNATTQFNVNGTQIACTNLSDCANLAKINASNTFTGTVQTAPVFNASTGFRIGGAAATNHVLLGNGTNYVDSATIPYSIVTGGPSAITPFAANGVPCATSTTTSTVCTSAQIVTQLNTSPTSTFAPALLPLATTSAFGAVKPDGTTISVSGGVISSIAATVTMTQSDVTGSRSFGTTFHNTGTAMIISGAAVQNGSSVGEIDCLVGPSTPTIHIWGQAQTATASGGLAGFICPVPAGYFYTVNVSGGGVSNTVSFWTETHF